MALVEMVTPMIRILIVDSCEAARTGIRETLRLRSDCKVVAEAGEGRSAISCAVECKPDIAIIELVLPDVDGICVTQRIRRRSATTNILAFTLLESETLVREAYATGALGCVFKSEPSRLLLDAVASLMNGDPYLSPKVAETLSRSSAAHQPSGDPLTRRERSVLRLVVEGHTNRGIGASLDITVKTVETHRAAIMRKLHLPSLAALVRYAVRNNIVGA